MSVYPHCMHLKEQAIPPFPANFSNAEGSRRHSYQDVTIRDRGMVTVLKLWENVTLKLEKCTSNMAYLTYIIGFSVLKNMEIKAIVSKLLLSFSLFYFLIPSVHNVI